MYLRKLAVARANGEASVSSLTDEGIELVAEWKETRLKDGQKFVGLAAGSRYAFILFNKDL